MVPSFIGNLAGAGVDWVAVKAFVEQSVGVSNDALHVAAGVLIQLGIAALAKRSLANSFPWLCLFTLQLTNEAIDLYIDRWPDLAMQLGEGAKDTLLTMFLPTVLLWLARRRPGVLVAR